MEIENLFDKESKEYKDFQKKALEQLMSGKSLTGKGDVFAPFFKSFLENDLEAEMENEISNCNKIMEK